MSAMASLREQLIGAWELVRYSAYLPSDKSNEIFPMGEDAGGIIMYTPDGYMSAQLGVKPDGGDGKSTRTYIAYTGRFWLDETGDRHGPLLVHEMRYSNLESLVGDKQRRLIQIRDESDEKYLILSTAEPVSIEHEQRIPLVKWRRLEINQAKKAPEEGAKLS